MSGKKSVSVGDALKKLLGRAFDEALPEEQPAEVLDSDMEDRLKNIEDALAKLVGGEEAVVVDEEGAVVTDAEEEGAVVTDAAKAMDERLAKIEDALMKLAGTESAAPAKDTTPGKATDAATVDAITISRAEILVPGLKPSAGLVKEALTEFAKTTDGAAILKTFDGLDDSSKFIAASELVKAKRAVQNSRPTIDQMASLGQGPMTPEKINEANAAHYSTGKK